MSLESEQPNTGLAVPGESTPAPHQPIERTTADAPAEGASDTEDRARAMGWVSKEEFRGPADNWRDADEFVRKGEEDLPIVRERLKDATRKVADFERRLRETTTASQQSIANLERMTTLALNKQRDQLIANYEAAKRNAVNSADEQRYDQLDRDMRAAVTAHDQQAYEAATPARPTQGQQAQLPPADAAAVSSWIDKNRWFQIDPELNVVAQSVHVRLGREKPGLSLEENLRETEDYVRQRYPDRFGDRKSVV